MVLTQPESLADEFDLPINVSIPLWFLRNLVRISERRWIRKFPYHYGSYATEKKEKKDDRPSIGFHTTMVLTQRKEVANDV